ncbi:DUF4198 domain-containing protein, partial [Sesbania bispinosa]
MRSSKMEAIFKPVKVVFRRGEEQRESKGLGERRGERVGKGNAKTVRSSRHPSFFGLTAAGWRRT